MGVVGIDRQLSGYGMDAGRRHDSLHLVFDMPIIEVVRTGPCQDTRNNADGHVPGDEYGQCRSHGIQQRKHIHFSIEKPQEGIKNRGRPIPTEGKSWAGWSFKVGKFFLVVEKSRTPGPPCLQRKL